MNTKYNLKLSCGGFRDPLQNYEPKDYSDPVERALVEDKVTAIQHRPASRISPETLVRDALEMLADLDVACLMVADGPSRLVGIFSERDVLDRVSGQYKDVVDQPVSLVMTRNPVFVYSTDSVAKALCVMAVSGYRHVPILDYDRNIVGIVSPLRVTSFLQSKVEAPSRPSYKYKNAGQDA